jgi:hypothetical protein|tara:strand:- start:361 stop:642 length:282 start_codon:yes stop_codon:yes gene_type:complete
MAQGEAIDVAADNSERSDTAKDIGRLQAQVEGICNRLDRDETAHQKRDAKIFKKLDNLAKTHNVAAGRKAAGLGILTAAAGAVGGLVNWLASH